MQSFMKKNDSNISVTFRDIRVFFKKHVHNFFSIFKRSVYSPAGILIIHNTG